MPEINAAIKNLTKARTYKDQIKFLYELPIKTAQFAQAPEFSPAIKKYLDKSGIKNLYSHQVQAIIAARGGKNVIMATPTASGKTLAFNIPVIEAIEKEPGACALYIYPAKALSNDQLKNLDNLKELSAIDFTAGIYDGDTESEKKKFLRENANIIITNPYELHQVIPYHVKWKRFYKNLKYIVIDEAHRYKGVFGSNIGLLVRRLQRILKTYGADPQIIAATASTANPGEFMQRLTGKEFEVVAESGSPAGKKNLLFWDPSMNPGRSVHVQTKDLLLHFASNDFLALAFVASRRLSELIRMWANNEAPDVEVLSYRAGYTPSVRREIEEKLRTGKIKGVVSTDALELGIDIGSLDVIIISGYPGSISSFWQQAGRAGRKFQESAIIFLPFEDALQKYILKHPQILLGMNFESAVISLENPNILSGHILCALSETPSPTEEVFEGAHTAELVRAMVDKGVVTKTPRGYVYTSNKRPQDVVSLNNIGNARIKIKVDGRILEEIELTRAYREAHSGAVYLHNGEMYVIKELNLAEGTAIATKEDVDYYTDTLKTEDVKILEVKETKKFDKFKLNFGMVSVTETYKGYRRKKGNETLAFEELHLPPLVFTTESVWVELNDSVVRKVKDENFDFDGAIHAAEHALIALSPLFAMCHEDDLGGMSYPDYEGSSIIFIYDGFEGGIGISRKLFEVFPVLNDRTIEMVSSCECETGCPSCVYSSKCGNNNNPIDKAGCVVLLKELV